MFLHSVSKVTGLGDGETTTLSSINFLEPGVLPSKRIAFNSTVQLPPLHIARRFFSAQYSFIGPIFAFTESADEFERSLFKAYDSLPDPSDQEACLAYAKLLLIMAFGQMYSVNQWVDTRGPPGFVYFTEALGILPDTHEEGSLLCVETLALAGYFLQNMNCRDAAFQFVGRALRMAISLGLHHEVQKSSEDELDEITRERRRRVWWSIYSLDRILSVKSGNPITIQDDDIGVQFPSRLPSEPEYCPAVVLRQYTKLSNILGQIHNKIYRKTSSRKTGKALMASVQKIVLALSDWDSELPYGLRFDPDRLSVGRESVSTLAHYYQCINMTVRPLVFHIVQKRLALVRGSQGLAAKEVDWKSGLSQATVKVIEMCIGAAHDSISIMAIAWQKDLVGESYRTALSYLHIVLTRNSNLWVHGWRTHLFGHNCVSHGLRGVSDQCDQSVGDAHRTEPTSRHGRARQQPHGGSLRALVTTPRCGDGPRREAPIILGWVWTRAFYCVAGRAKSIFQRLQQSNDEQFHTTI